MTKDLEFAIPQYQINVFFLKMLGQWPFQSKLSKFLLIPFWIFIVSVAVISSLIPTIFESTEEILIINITCHMTSSASIAKAMNCFWNGNKIRQMIGQIENDWAKSKNRDDHNIMVKYANDAKKFTILYCFILLSSMVAFLLLPLRPKIMVWLGLSDSDAEYQFPYFVNYGVDNNENFLYVEANIVMGTFWITATVISQDALVLIFIQHMCGVFATVCHRLENIPTRTGSHNHKENDIGFKIISECIQQHSEALQFAEYLEDTYCWSFFYGVSMNTLLLTLSGIRIVTCADDTDELVRFVPYSCCLLVHIFVENIMVQRLINHSSQVDYSIIMVKWYSLSRRSQKLLNIITLRSRINVRITAGKIFILSSEFFSTVLKTSMSYFTILRSVQHE